MNLTRRHVFSLLAAAGAGTLTGCIDGGTDGVGEEGVASARASFFVFGDVTSRVAGETATAELLVPVGQHGHGWEPGAGVRGEIREADLLVHGPTGFQPWVDDIRRELGTDGTDVATVDVSEGVGMLEPGDRDTGEDGHADSVEEHEREEGHDDGHEGYDEHDGHEGYDELDHRYDGHEEHDVEDGGGDVHDGDGEGHGHGPGEDPHFWMDPLRVKTTVDNVRRALAGVDPEGADSYVDNAEVFREELDGLHRRLESTVEEGSKDVILVAGHDYLGYFSDRYGVKVESLTDVSPDAGPTLRDRERAQEIVETHGLRYVCADPLESQQAAEQIVAETAAEEVLPLTAMPGLTEEWDGEDWGYLDVMENVNLPALERALEA